MKPQKKAVVALKAQKTPIAVAKKRRTSPEKFTIADTKKLDKKPSKKTDRPEESKKKLDGEKKKLEQSERRRKTEQNKKIAEEKKKEKMEKLEDAKKKLFKEGEKKFDAAEDKKLERCIERIEETENDCEPTSNDINKKKNLKLDDKAKTEKSNLEAKKKIDKTDDKKKTGKTDEIQEDSQKFNNSGFDENSLIEDKTEVSAVGKKKGKEDKKKEGKTIKPECKENSKSPMTKEKKITEAKKSPDKETAKKVAVPTTTTTLTTPTTLTETATATTTTTMSMTTTTTTTTTMSTTTTMTAATTAATTTTTTTATMMTTGPSTVKKDSKPRQQTQKKATTKKIVLAKKSLSPLAKKLIEKKLKLVKIPRENEDDNGAPDEEQNTVVDGSIVVATNVAVAKTKKKQSIISKPKSAIQKKKPKLAKQMKVKIPPKNAKINNVFKKDKIMNNKKKFEAKDSSEKSVSDGIKKTTGTEEVSDNLETNEIKRELCDDKEDEKFRDDSTPIKTPDSKRATDNSVKPKNVKKSVKKTTKLTKSQSDESDQLSMKSEDVSLEDLMKQSSKNSDKIGKISGNSKKEPNEATIEMDLKMEEANGDESSVGGLSGEASPTSASDSEDNYEDESEIRGRARNKKVNREDGKERDSSSSDERARRMRLFGFWSGPKRHRVASLNALAKVHCLYENEAGGVYLGGFCKPKPDKEKPKKPASVAAAKDDGKDDGPAKKTKVTKKVADVTKVEDNNKRNLRNVPGLRGKHWDMAESSSSSSSSSSDEDGEREKAATRAKKRNTTRRKKPEEVMDLKDMVVCKRMASLNASAILAASYSDEKNRLGSSASDTSSESEVEVVKKRKQGDTEMENKRKSAGRQVSGDPGEEVIKPSKNVVIVNQDTDVTITGVYVNQTRSTHHEGFCSIAGMQYRISSTSHTQTAATAVAAELHEQQKPELPCKSYTPLGALSSMQPPGSQGSHPNMSPRRHSAFSAPHQHGYYQPAGPLIQHPPTLPPVKAPPPEPTPTPPQNSEGSDDLVATSTTSGGTNSTGGGGFYRAYCPQYYGTPPQYQELCYPPTYSHPHSHPPYYKYAPTYRRQYYGYPGADGGGGTGGAGPGTPGVVEYQAPPPGEYPMPPYYGGYPPPPPPPPPPPNPAYLHPQGRPIVDHAAFQGCPCPMQSCPKNVDTGPLIGNGKGAPVASGPGLSLPPSALVGPPSPARGLAGLAPPHGANAWDTDRVQLNTHRSNLNSQGQSQQQQQQQIPPASSVHSIVAGAHNRAQNAECRTKDENNCTDDKLDKCNCQKRACTSTCEVKLEALSPTETLSSSTSCQNEKTIRDFKLENNNVKCESCSVGVVVGQENISCSANCNVKCESGYKCEIMKCEQCMKEGQMAMMKLDKDSGISLIDEKRLETDSGVKEEINDVIIVDTQNWQKPDYEPIVQDVIDETEIVVSDDVPASVIEELPKCQPLTKRKLSLDSLSDGTKKRKVDKRTLSVGSTRDFTDDERPSSEIILPIVVPEPVIVEAASNKSAKKDAQCQKRKAEIDGSAFESTAAKKTKNSKITTSNGTTNNGFKTPATDSSINETIDDVIQQSLLMSRKKERKCDIAEKMVDGKKKKGSNLLSTIKKVTKKIDLVKTVAEKLCLTKNETKVAKDATTNRCKVETKIKSNKTQQDTKWKSNAIISSSGNNSSSSSSNSNGNGNGNSNSNSKVSKTKMTEVKSKVVDSKLKVPDVKTKELPKKIEIDVSDSGSTTANISGTVVPTGCCTSTVPKIRVIEVCENVKRAALVKKKRKSTKKTSSCAKKAIANAGVKPVEDVDIVIENCSLAKRPFLKPKWSNGWSWEGVSYEAKVYLTNEESAIRRCYASMKHVSGDVLRPRDCVLLKSGQRKADLPFVAKIAALWENPDDGEMMFSLLWYYRPEHTEQGRTDYDTEDEVFASRHRDANSVACIEDKCYILTFNEYCRYRKNLRRVEEGLESPGLIVPPGEQAYPRECRQPPIPVPSDMVLFCRRVYDYRGKKLVKNPG